MSRHKSEYPPAEAFFPPRRTLAALAHAVQDCRACPLYRHATQAVFGEGRRDARAVKHFKFEPRGKRRIHKKPGATEVQACLPWLEAELEKVGPEMIVCLGATATRAVLGPKVGVVRDRGKVFPSEWAPWVMPTYHPSALLRAPDDQRDATRQTFLADLRIAARRYGEISHSAGTKRDAHDTRGMRAQPGGDHGTRHGTRGAR